MQYPVASRFLSVVDQHLTIQSIQKEDNTNHNYGADVGNGFGSM